MMRRLVILKGVTAKVDGADQHAMAVSYDEETKDIEIAWPVQPLGWDSENTPSGQLNIPPAQPTRLVRHGEYQPDEPDDFPGPLV